jgi:arylsulfatase A-like enzyme
MNLKLWLGTVAASAIFFSGCKQGLSPQPSGNAEKSVLLIVIDTLRADYLSSYGSRIVKSPHIDRLAAEGIRFENAFSHIPITGPAHTALFTAEYPSDAGVRNNGQVLAASHTCLAETMLASGRTTAGFVSLGVLEAQFGFDQGFQKYRDDLGIKWHADAREINTKVFEWLEEEPPSPFFAFVHYCDPHEPYFAHGTRQSILEAKRGEDNLGTIDIAEESLLSLNLEVPAGNMEIALACESEFRFRAATLEPEGAGVRYQTSRGWRKDENGFPVASEGTILLRNESERIRSITLNLYLTEILTLEEILESYVAEVEFVDRAIGELLDTFRERGMLENTLLLLTSDHGEGLGEHGETGHIEQLYDSMVRIPLILHSPKDFPQGVVVRDPVSLVDLFPTICDTLSLPMTPDVPGRSLLPLLDGDDATREKYVYLETYAPEAPMDLIGLRTGKWKYIRTPKTGKEELYRVVEDPKELNDLVDSSTDEVHSFRALLGRLGRLSETGDASDPSHPVLDEETLQKLKSLGYVH